MLNSSHICLSGEEQKKTNLPPLRYRLVSSFQIKPEALLQDVGLTAPSDLRTGAPTTP